MQVGDETSATLFSASDSIDNNFTNEISNERYKVTTEDGKTYTSQGIGMLMVL